MTATMFTSNVGNFKPSRTVCTPSRNITMDCDLNESQPLGEWTSNHCCLICVYIYIYVHIHMCTYMHMHVYKLYIVQLSEVNIHMYILLYCSIPVLADSVFQNHSPWAWVAVSQILLRVPHQFTQSYWPNEQLHGPIPHPPPASLALAQDANPFVGFGAKNDQAISVWIFGQCGTLQESQQFNMTWHVLPIWLLLITGENNIYQTPMPFPSCSCLCFSLEYLRQSNMVRRKIINVVRWLFLPSI